MADPKNTDLDKEPVVATITEPSSTPSSEPKFYPIGAAGATDTTLTVEQATQELAEARSRYFAGTATEEEYEAAKANAISARTARRR